VGVGPGVTIWKVRAAEFRSASFLEGVMTERDPNIVKSSLSRTVTKDGITVRVEIVRLERETEWSLEVVNAKNTSVVWDELFATDEDAYAEFERTVAEEGMRTFLDSGKVIPFPH
jgi:hypothetical protein